MQFELLPLIDQMIEYYGLPGGFERFKEYLRLLTGDTHDEVHLPIGGFNPLGKEHVLDKLKELKEIDAEKLIAERINEINQGIADRTPGRTIKVSLSLAD